MTAGLARYHHSKQAHFVTFSCYHRRPYMSDVAARNLFLSALEQTRREYSFRVYAYVVMPEHVHLVLSEPERATLAQALQALKVSVSKRLRWKSGAFWQKRYYDHNIRDHEKFSEKLRYVHRNPVRRGLCEKPEDWAWSSFRHYALRETGPVEIESEWAARLRRESGTPTLTPNTRA